MKFNFKTVIALFLLFLLGRFIFRKKDTVMRSITGTTTGDADNRSYMPIEPEAQLVDLPVPLVA